MLSDAVVSVPARKNYSLGVFQAIIRGKPVILNRNSLNGATMNANGEVYWLDNDSPHNILELFNLIYWNKRTRNREAAHARDRWVEEFLQKGSFSF
jgi:hypothetical protein